MTDRERDMIEYYLPGDPDPELQDGEFYYLQTTMKGEQVIKVFPLDILPIKDGTEYGIYQQRGGRLVWVDTGYGDRHRGTSMANLYDNKKDCRNQTHYMCEYWQKLRKLQKEEANP